MQGTEKQIAWAETIRAEALNELSESIERSLKTPTESDPRYDAIICMIERIRAIGSAHWWIENRDRSWHIYSICEELATKARGAGMDVVAAIDAAFREHAPAPAPPAETQTAEIEAKAEATLRPEKPLTETVAEIRVEQTTISVLFPERREDFRELVRFKLGYEWVNNRWQWTLTPTAGSIEDRAAELGYRLLAAGFCVRVYDPDIRAKIIAGEYEPECKRWIYRITGEKHAGWFGIKWPRGEDFYAAARRLPGSRYDKPAVVVPAEQFEQVLDFAEMHGFRLTDAAQTLAEQAKGIKEAALTARVGPKEETEKPPSKPGRKPKPLSVPENVQVADEFRE